MLWSIINGITKPCTISMDMYVICEVVMKVLSLVVISCVLNQNCGHWLFEDALKFIIFDTCELHDELVN